VLTVALSHGRDIRPDGHQLPSRLLRRAPALETHSERDLVADDCRCRTGSAHFYPGSSSMTRVRSLPSTNAIAMDSFLGRFMDSEH
jgi:hypothetical protein